MHHDPDRSWSRSPQRNAPCIFPYVCILAWSSFYLSSSSFDSSSFFLLPLFSLVPYYRESGTGYNLHNRREFSLRSGVPSEKKGTPDRRLAWIMFAEQRWRGREAGKNYFPRAWLTLCVRFTFASLCLFFSVGMADRGGIQWTSFYLESRFARVTEYESTSHRLIMHLSTVYPRMRIRQPSEIILCKALIARDIDIYSSPQGSRQSRKFDSTAILLRGSGNEWWVVIPRIHFKQLSRFQGDCKP